MASASSGLPFPSLSETSEEPENVCHFDDLLNPDSDTDSLPETSGNTSTATTNVFVYHQWDMCTSSMSMMDDLRRRGDFCDVTIVVGNHHLKAHKVVLASSIPYFHAMFTHDMKEREMRCVEIKESGLQPSPIEALINFAYSGRVSISSVNVQGLMVASNYLQLSRVFKACGDYLMTCLTPHNVLNIRAFAQNLSSLALINACDKFVAKHFVHVTRSNDFLHLELDQVSEITSQDELHISGEQDVFEAIIKWIEFELEKRKDVLPHLLANVRLPLVKPQFLSDNVAKHDLIRTCHRCRDLLDEARDFHLMPERRFQIQSFKTKPRRCQDAVGVIYAVGGQTKTGNSISTVEAYDPILCRWRESESMSMLRSRVGVASMGTNQLYAVGGYNGSDRLSDVELFDASTRKWSKVASMQCKRSAVGVVAIDRCLYVCGGFDGVASLDTVERYDAEKDSWTTMASMSRPRSASGVCQVDGKVYVMGGHNSHSIFDSVECYDPQTNEWSEVASMSSKRCRLGVTAMGGKIYACGGYDGRAFLRSVEVYDPLADKWSYMPPMNLTRSRVALATTMDRLWAIGGYDGMKNLSSVEMYDNDNGQWVFVSPMNAHAGGVGVAVLPLVP